MFPAPEDFQDLKDPKEKKVLKKIIPFGIQLIEKLMLFFDILLRRRRERERAVLYNENS